MLPVLACAAGAAFGADASLQFELQRRDPASGAVKVEQLTVEPRRVGIVVVDMWNWHWCKTSTARVAALVPRMKRVLAAAHELGMVIFWCPSDVADNYAGTPQHEAASIAPRWSLPALANLDCPPAPDGGGCTCGKERCLVNYGWDAMHPDLQMYEGDFLPNDLETLYSLCKERGLTHLIYLGVHTQVCLLGKSIGLKNMTRAGFQCILARDLTDAHGRYDPDQGVTPDGFTAEVVAHFERYLAPTINFAEEMKKAGKWDRQWVVDPVRLAPWGTRERPHLFQQEVTVTLSAPWEPTATIVYTVDGSEPTPDSDVYHGPIKLRQSTTLRAAAFENGRAVCLPTDGRFALRGELPPAPDRPLAELEPRRAVGPGHSPSSTDHRFSPVSAPPQKNRSNRGASLRLRGKEYQHGLGVHAPNQLVYDVKPEYDRFVALAGVDEHILEVNLGSNLARYPSVVFKIFIDGKLVSESPVMRISETPWPFDVRIPTGSKRIDLIATDAGDGNREDLANWVDAGFVVKK